MRTFLIIFLVVSVAIVAWLFVTFEEETVFIILGLIPVAICITLVAGSFIVGMWIEYAEHKERKR